MEFIKNSGGCVASNNIINKNGVLKWCIRENPLNPVDNGWRFLSSVDTEEFLSVSSNMSVWDFNRIAEVEPSILSIYDMPIGTDITLIYEGNKKYFIYTDTGEMVDP